MQTQLTETFRATPAGQEAERILRSCVHCGFCLATCPTYQLLGNELDSPRGRIYLIKNVLEGEPATAKTQLHLDRCLTCRNCETTCPSGVEYAKLLDLGRAEVERQVGRTPWAWLQRAALTAVLPYPRRFTPLLRVGQALRPVMPAALQAKLPPRQSLSLISSPLPTTHRRMLLLAGCVQPGLAPNINLAATRLLNAMGIAVVEVDGCCGALSFHLNQQADGLNFMRSNVDTWMGLLDDGAEAIVSTASGCGVTVQAYDHYLHLDPNYAVRASQVAAVTRDLASVIQAEAGQLIAQLSPLPQPVKLAWHAPCTLQHGQQVRGVVESLLTQAGYDLVQVADPHLCCGSAGTYALLQPQLATQLKQRKLAQLQAGDPQVIVTANIGCLTHLQSGTTLPVRHWAELLADRL